MTKVLQKLKLDDENRVILTDHLFYAREGEKRWRIAVFRNSFQILDVIRYAIKEADLLSYRSKGKLALIVPLLNKNYGLETYGIAVSVEPSTDTCNYKNDIIIITIDKRDSRHYTDSLQLAKSKCRFYLNDYRMIKSYNGSWLINKSVFKLQRKKVEVQFTPFYTKREDSFLNTLPRGYSLDIFFISLFAHGVKDNLNKGAFWYLVNIENKYYVYARVAIEESWNQKYYQIIMLDEKDESEYAFIERGGEKFYEGCIEVSEKISRHRQNRLKIVKKREFLNIDRGQTSMYVQEAQSTEDA